MLLDSDKQWIQLIPGNITLSWIIVYWESFQSGLSESVEKQVRNWPFVRNMCRLKLMRVRQELWDGEKHYHLELRSLRFAIPLKDKRLNKNDDNKAPWIGLVQTPQYKAGLKERDKFERNFSEAQQWHGFGRCRYNWNSPIQDPSLFTAVTLKLKRTNICELAYPAS